MNNMENNLTGLQHIGIPTNDIAATIAFYEKLGFSVAWDNMDKDVDEKVAFLQLGDMVVETYENHQAAKTDGAVNHIAINVRSVEAAYDYINELGLNNMSDTIHYLPFLENGVRYFMIKGVNEEKIEFNEKLTSLPL